MTAFNPPSNLFFNGITFNSKIIEGGTVVSGVGDVTLAGDNTFTGNNTFTNVIKTNAIDTITTPTPLYIGQNNANQILLGDSTNAIPITISGTINVYDDEIVVDEDAGKKYVTLNQCFFTTGTGNEATIDTKTAVPLHIAPSTTVEPNAICSGVVIGNSTIPVTVAGNTISLTGNTTFSGANTYTSSNNFTGGSIDVTTQTAGNNTTLAASTEFVNNAIAGVSGVSLTANNNFTGANSFTGGSITMTTQTAGNNTTFGASTAFVRTAISALSSVYRTNAQVNTAINNNNTALRAATNTWSGANSFTTGSITMSTQTAGNNSTFGASTAFVTDAISALSSVYQTAAQVTTAITSYGFQTATDVTTAITSYGFQTATDVTTAITSYGFQTATDVTTAITSYGFQTATDVTTAINSELTTFSATSNTFTANQIFPTIQFSTGTLNQAFYIQHVNSFGFGAITANTAVVTTFTYADLGLTNFTTFITAQICNSSAAAQGNRVIFSIQAQSATSFTIVGFNVTATNTSASAFSLVVYGR